MSECRISTIDNPYDPFIQFDEWNRFDLDMGYNSCEYLARIAETSDEFSDEENNEEIERAIDEIIHYDPFGRYIKVSRPNNSE